MLISLNLNMKISSNLMQRFNKFNTNVRFLDEV